VAIHTTTSGKTNPFSAGPAECSPRLLGPLAGRSLSAGGLDRPARHLSSKAPRWGLFFCFAGRSNMAPNPSGRCRAFTISPRVGLQMVDNPSADLAPL
jgi:hypothetical protein